MPHDLHPLQRPKSYTDLIGTNDLRALMFGARRKGSTMHDNWRLSDGLMCLHLPFLLTDEWRDRVNAELDNLCANGHHLTRYFIPEEVGFTVAVPVHDYEKFIEAAITREFKGGNVR